MAFAWHQSAFVGASVLTVASFLGATAYSQSRLAALDTLSSTIASNAVPSIEFLGRGGVRLQRLRQLLDDEVTANHSSAAIETATAELEALDTDVDRYLRLAPLSGERELWADIKRDLETATAVVRQILEALRRGDQATSAALLQNEAEPAFQRATSTILATMEFDVDESERLARDIESVRRATTRNIMLLDALATIVAAFTAMIAFRAALAHDHLLQRHNALLAERVDDLDRFAGRAAHDILSPLNTVSVGLALVGRSADLTVRGYVERSQRALGRVQQLVEGLLQFARSGVQTDSSAAAAVDVVMRTTAADCFETARAADVVVTVDAPAGLEVGCSVGVLTSVVQNLVSNAIKYMGAAPVRQVTLRARGNDHMVGIEVEDTGPGIPPELHPSMFKPFVRGSHDHIPGLGLGLSTVKRLVEAHRGRIDVQSKVGTGTIVRIELPRRHPAALERRADVQASIGQ